MEVSPAHLHRLRMDLERYVTPPELYRRKEALFSAVSRYIDGAFDNKVWNAADASKYVVRDYLGWIYDNPPSVFKAVVYLGTSSLCCKLERYDWARLLLRF